MPHMGSRAVVIGLDGVAWHLLEPFIQQGHMPRLAALRERGASGILNSTVPTYTPPAWTSAVTGVNPGRHGIYGFHATHAQHERMELMHSGKIQAPTVWQMANSQGSSIGIYNVPLTYPPQQLESGWMVSGMMTPSYGHHLKGVTFPPELEQKVLDWAPGYEVEIKTSWEDDHKNDALCKRALESLAQRKDVLGGLLSEHPVDVLFTVIETPDRLQHAYYRYMDPDDEMYRSEMGRKIRPALERCFAAMDDIVGILDDYVGHDGGAIVCSDHGFTAWEYTVHTNALLEQWGLLKMKGSAKLMQTAAARALVPIAKRVLPAKVAREAKGKTFEAIDWEHTRAFASPIPQQGVFVNLKGREPRGVVDESDLKATKDEIAEHFRALRGPDGRPATDRVFLSEDVFHGEALRGAPDVLPVLRDHRFELVDEIFHKEPFADVSDLPRGVHHPNGVVVYAGPGIMPGTRVSGNVMDITPTLLYMAGLMVPEGLDGSVATAAYKEDHLKIKPVRTMAAPETREADEESPYSAEEEAQIEESLRGLGYL
jgi:predicted AlkP superfamily phosphohydrolase/phosphomutase